MMSDVTTHPTRKLKSKSYSNLYTCRFLSFPLFLRCASLTPNVTKFLLEQECRLQILDTRSATRPDLV